MYRIEFDIVALFISFITFIVYHRQKQMASKRNSVFYLIIIFISLATLFSLLSSIALNYLGTLPTLFANITNTAYLLFHTHIPFFYCIYIFILTDYRLTNIIQRILFTLPWIALLFLVLGNPFHHALFYFTNSHYHRGTFHLLLYFLSGIYISFSFYVLFRRYKKLNFIELSSFFAALVFPFIAILFQFFLPGMILECFSFSIAALFLLLIVQNDKNLIDPITELKNNFAFDTVLKERLLQKNSFTITLVHSRELKAIQSYLDNNSYNALLKEISDWLLEFTKRKFQLFALSDNLFALISSRFAKAEIIGELSLDIIRRSQEPWTLGETEIQLTFQTAAIHVPNDCKTGNQVRDYIEQFQNLAEVFSDRHIIYAQNFIPENHLRQARIAYMLQEKIEKRSLEISYQAIYSKKTNAIFALESLISFPLPDGSITYQSEILKIAERIGLGKQLGKYIIEESFSWYVQNNLTSNNIILQIRLLESFCFEINWANTIIDLAKKTGMDISRVCLQLTETSIANSLDNIKDNMILLKLQSASFALDDYGSGYTDFGEILDIPFTTVKLDKKIVHAAFVSSVGERLLEGTVSLFKQLNWPIVAEGVETKEHLDYLIGLGLEYFQGYYIGYPEQGTKILRQIFEKRKIIE